jgi:hypothetical protein
VILHFRWGRLVVFSRGPISIIIAVCAKLWRWKNSLKVAGSGSVLAVNDQKSNPAGGLDSGRLSFGFADLGSVKDVKDALERRGVTGGNSRHQGIHAGCEDPNAFI